jgi:hypothetical protein
LLGERQDGGDSGLGKGVGEKGGEKGSGREGNIETPVLGVN